MDISQSMSARSIKLQATHNAIGLSKQIPMWDIGQLAAGNDEDNSNPYWSGETEGMKSIMKMGTRPLKMLSNKQLEKLIVYTKNKTT